MILLAAAISDEIRAVLQLCVGARRLEIRGVKAWAATCGGRPLLLLKTGIGPDSGTRLRRLLQHHVPSGILVCGFAGALDPALRLGAPVLVRRASLLHIPDSVSWADECTLSESFELDAGEAHERAAAEGGLCCVSGDCLTSPWTIGDPAQKSALRARFGAAVVDMETAVLARAAQSRGIPVSCIRTVSDEADDPLLAPFSRAASSAAMFRLGSWVGRGHLVLHRDEWQRRVRCAQSSLQQYLCAYFAAAVHAPECTHGA